MGTRFLQTQVSLWGRTPLGPVREGQGGEGQTAGAAKQGGGCFIFIAFQWMSFEVGTSEVKDTSS